MSGIVFLMTSVFLAGHVMAQADDCTLSRDALVPLLSGKSKKNIQGRHLTESLLLADGVKVTYRVGGCAHYAYSFTYENMQPPPAMEKKALLDASVSLLQKTPIMKTVNAVNVKVLLQALERARASGEQLEKGVLTLPCGDANCTVDVSAPGKLTIEQDFPL